MSRMCAEGCGRIIYSSNRTGICRFCKKERKKEISVSKKDDDILDRIQGTKPKEESENQKNGRKGGQKRAVLAKEKPPKVTYVEKLKALATALGLKPDDMIEDWCKKWYDETTTKALAPPVEQKLLPAGNIE